MQPKKYHHGDLKRTLLKVADGELSLSGAEALSLREIAKKAGVSHTAPYKHFSDKEQLLQEMVRAEYKNLVQFSAEVEWRYPDNLELQLASFAEKFLILAETLPRKLNLMLSESKSEDFSKEVTSYHVTIKENLLQLFTSHKDPNVVDSFWAGLVGTALLFSQGRIANSRVESLSVQLLQSLKI